MKDVSGKWTAIQSGDELVHFDLQQDKNGKLFGTASNNDGSITSADITGTVSDTDFLAIIRWNNGAEGEYNGRFGIENRLTGIAFNRNDVSQQATWFSERGFADFHQF